MWIWELLESVLAVIGKFLDWMLAREAQQGQRLREELDAVKQRDEELQKADAAREAVRADVAGGVSIDDRDPFLRD